MMFTRGSLLLLALAYLTVGKETTNDGPDFGSTCGVYYAASTIPGAGYGLFAGKDFEINDWIMPGDLVVPIVEINWHNGHESYANLWEDYQWSARSFDGMDREGESVSGASFGIGALPNCFAPFINLEETYTQVDWGDLHRSRDPGAGAFTPYHARTAYAYDTIAAGMELFVDYGETYFPSREYMYGPIPLLEDYAEGDKLMERLLYVVEVIEEDLVEEDVCSAEGSCLADKDTWRYHLRSELLSYSHEMGVMWGSKPLLTLPENATLVDYLYEHGTQYMHYNRSKRSLEWLEEHGQCADNIKPGKSTIAQAGRGGFASRPLAAGSLVAPLPLIHIPDRSIYNMYAETVDGRYSELTLTRNLTDVVGKQLLLNYCFGHGSTTVLLCPYGIATSLINHSQKGANAKLTWSTKGTRHPEWFDQPVEEWGDAEHAGMAFDLIALRDIAQDEEIFIDYGDEWEAAWQAHAAQWKPPPGAEDYHPSLILNEMPGSKIRTLSEGSYQPDDKLLYCREIYRRMAGAREERYFDFRNCRALDRYVNTDGETRYLVETYKEEENPWFCWEAEPFIVFDMPRSGFNFRDGFYSYDHSQKWAFRFDMRIPDELMHDAWKNVL